jgi:hypothetical protein
MQSQKVSKSKCGLPAFGHKTHLRVLIDSDLLQYDPVRDKSSGSPNEPRLVRTRAAQVDASHWGPAAELKRR